MKPTGDYCFQRRRRQIGCIVATVAVALLAVLGSQSAPAKPAPPSRTVDFHSPLMKGTTGYLYMGRKTLTLHLHNGMDHPITQAVIDLAAYWPANPAEGRKRKEVDFDNRYRLVAVRRGGVAPYSDGVLTVDWNSDVKAGTKDDPIVPTKTLQEDSPVYLYGDELGDRPNVQAWLQDEIVVWKGVSITFAAAPSSQTHSQPFSKTLHRR